MPSNAKDQLARSYPERIPGTIEQDLVLSLNTSQVQKHKDMYHKDIVSLEGGLQETRSSSATYLAWIPQSSQGSPKEANLSQALCIVPGRRKEHRVMSPPSAQDWSEDLTLKRATERPLSSPGWHGEGAEPLDSWEEETRLATASLRLWDDGDLYQAVWLHIWNSLGVSSFSGMYFYIRLIHLDYI